MLKSQSRTASTGRYYAHVVTRPGTVQVDRFILDHDKEEGSVSVVSTVSSDFEIETGDKVAAMEWILIAPTANGKRAKRRKSEGPASPDAKNTGSGYFVIILASGKVMIFSSLQREVVNEFQIEDTVLALSSAKGALWIATETELHEYEINSTKPKTTLQLPKTLKSVRSINAIEQDGKVQIAVSGDETVVIDSDGIVLTTIESKSNAAIIVKDLVIIAREKELISFNAKSAHKLEAVKLPKAISTFVKLTDDIVGAWTVSGTLDIITDPKTLSHNWIRSNTKKIRLSGLFALGANFIAVWFDLVPKFQSIEVASLTENVVIETEIIDKTKKKETQNAQKAQEVALADLEPVEKFNVRESELVTLIEENWRKQAQLLTILLSNEDETKIKTVAASISKEAARAAYKAVSARVTAGPAESLALNLWLKWIVMDKSRDLPLHDTKTLKRGIRTGLKQMPTLLALQGRLELLQSQLHLREQIKNQADAVDGLELGDEADTVKQAEESIVYVNGENDDGDDVLEEGGASQSDSDSDSDVEDITDEI